MCLERREYLGAASFLQHFDARRDPHCPRSQPGRLVANLERDAASAGGRAVAVPRVAMSPHVLRPGMVPSVPTRVARENEDAFSATVATDATAVATDATAAATDATAAATAEAVTEAAAAARPRLCGGRDASRAGGATQALAFDPGRRVSAARGVTRARLKRDARVVSDAARRARRVWRNQKPGNPSRVAAKAALACQRQAKDFADCADDRACAVEGRRAAGPSGESKP